MEYIYSNEFTIVGLTSVEHESSNLVPETDSVQEMQPTMTQATEED